MVKRQRFTAEFKREAIRLLDAGDRPASEIAIDLGIRRNQLYKWQAQLRRSGEASFQGSGRKPADSDSEIARLKRELARVTEERDILKKRPRTLRRNCHEVRLHPQACPSFHRHRHVSCFIG